MHASKQLALLLPLLLGASASSLRASDPESFYARFGDPEIQLPGNQDQVFRGRVAAHLSLQAEDPTQPDREPPRAFAPLADGSVALLWNHPPRLQIQQGETQKALVELAGGDFRPDGAAPIDLLPFGKEHFLILDQAAGTLWKARRNGTIEGRTGLFLGPQALGRGADGTILVDDPGNQAVAVFSPDLSQETTRKGRQIYAAASAQGSLPFLRDRKDQRAVLVGQVPAKGANPEPQRLAVLEAPAGQVVLDSEVIGWTGEDLFVAVRSAQEDDQWPRATTIWQVQAGGAPRSQQVPTTTNYCTDCGPEFRLGPEGKLWRMVLARGEYWILELEEGTKP